MTLRDLRWIIALACGTFFHGSPAYSKTMAEVLTASRPGDWRPLDPANTLYLELDAGRVVIELAPQFAPQMVANVKTLVKQKYFDGLFIVRAQDNYVVQWGDPDGKRSQGLAKKTIPAEFERTSAGLNFTSLPDPDTYASQTGFVAGFPAAQDPNTKRAWLTHCYGMLGAARGNEKDSGNGSGLYVVIGHAPRQLDRNITVLGRVVQGMELLSAMARGKGELGFYQKPEERTPLRSVRLAADTPEAQRSNLEVLHTDSQTFSNLIEARRNRKEEWYKLPAGRIDVCNVPLPVRERKAKS